MTVCKGDNSSFQSDTSDTGSNKDIPVVHDHHIFMYLQIQVGCHSVTALLDSGSAINIFSKPFYDSIPQSCILQYHEKQ